jgi:MFS family permease
MWVLRFLFGWAAWEATHSAFWVGTIAGFMLVPTFLLSPLFGITADRINPRNGLIVTTALQALLCLVAAAIHHYGALTLSWLMVLALLFGAMTAAHTPIRLALLPKLVDRRALPSAIGYSAIIFNSSRILGPAVGAWLLTLVPVPAVFAVAALSMSLAVLVLLRVTGVEGGRPPKEGESLRSQLAAGVRYAARHDAIRVVFLLTLTSGMLGRTFIELLPAVSGAVLQGGPTVLATLTASAGVGSILGGLIVSRQSGKLPRLFRLVLYGLTLASAVLLTAVFWESVRVVSVAVALVSLCTTTIGTGNQALAQLMVEDEYRGRVMSLWTVVAMGTPAVGAVLVGGVADRVGFPAALAGCAIIALAVVVLSRSRVAELGRVRREVAGAEAESGV